MKLTAGYKLKCSLESIVEQTRALGLGNPVKAAKELNIYGFYKRNKNSSKLMDCYGLDENATVIKIGENMRESEVEEMIDRLFYHKEE